MKIKNVLLLVFIYVVGIRASVAQCSYKLPNDTTFCLKDSTLNFTINGPSGYDTYAWSTGDTTKDIVINTNGVYSCTAAIKSGNLIINGDFGFGDTLFTTDYEHGTFGFFGLLSFEDTYTVTTDPNIVHSGFLSFGDHTSGSGEMFVCNGDSVPGRVVWKQTIAVSVGTNYNFSAWAASVANITLAEAAELQFSINGVLIGPAFSPSLDGGIWTNFFETWNSGLATSATIAIVDQSIVISGNDFALDDIFFQQICSYTDSIQVVASNCSPTPVPEMNDIIIPNVFTPNGDNKNDQFFIKNLESDVAKLTIYNRWGNLIYSSNGYNNDWDGKGTSDGVYYYIMDYPVNEKKYIGFVEILHN